MLKKQTLDGFTLIELMIAIMLLSVAALGLCSIFITTTSLDKTMSNISIATFAVHGKMEKLLNKNFSELDSYNIAPNNTFSVPENEIPHKDMLLKANGDKAGSIKIIDPDYKIGDKQVRVIEVLVEWRMGKSTRNNKVKISTMVYED